MVPSLMCRRPNCRSLFGKSGNRIETPALRIGLSWVPSDTRAGSRLAALISLANVDAVSAESPY